MTLGILTHAIINLRPDGRLGRESRLGGIPLGNPASLKAYMSGADRYKASLARTERFC